MNLTRKNNRAFVFLALAFLSNCDNEARLLQKDYPFVVTNTPVVNIDGATFSARILSPGNQEILKYGFVWGEDHKPDLMDYNMLYVGEIEKETYTFTIKSGLEEGKDYNVRSCILTDQYEIFGNTESFTSLGSLPPEILNFAPKYGPIGTPVIMDGKNFALSTSGNIIKFGNTEAIIDSVSDTRLYATIPIISKPERVQISIEVAGKVANSKDFFDLWFPWKVMNDFNGGSLLNPAGFSIQDRGYFGLGYGITDFWEYNPKKDMFTKKSDFPKAISADPYGFTINDRGYVIFSTGHYNHYSITELWEYNPIGDQWTRKADFPGIARSYLVTFNIADKGYVVTGKYWDDGGDDHYPKDFWEYDPMTDSWTKRADFPGTDRARAFGFSLGQNGYLGTGSTGWLKKDLYKYNQLTDTWSYISEYPGDGFNFIKGFTIDNRCYLGLGSNNSADTFSDFWEFNPETNEWKEMRSCLLNMVSFLAFTIDDKGYIGIGWNDNFGFVRNVYEFDPQKN